MYSRGSGDWVGDTSIRGRRSGDGVGATSIRGPRRFFGAPKLVGEPLAGGLLNTALVLSSSDSPRPRSSLEAGLASFGDRVLIGLVVVGDRVGLVVVASFGDRVGLVVVGDHGLLYREAREEIG
eukprot:SAG11_NODE_10659_length_813_cov_6.357143_1_plen_124_part_00